MPKIAISAMHGCRHFVFMRSRDITSQSGFLSLHVPNNACAHLVLKKYQILALYKRSVIVFNTNQQQLV